MIAYVSGSVVSIHSDSIIIDNQGLGYRIFTPDPFVYKQGESAILYTYHHVREDAMILFGFVDTDSLDLFTQLITVKGLGPKTGMGIMSKARYKTLVDAVESADASFLKTLPGVGPKMASQIILDLKGKLVNSDTVTIKNSVIDDVFTALMDLGFKKAELSRIKDSLVKHENQELDSLIRYALSLLSR